MTDESMEIPSCGPDLQDAFTTMVNQTANAAVRKIIGDASRGAENKVRELLEAEVKRLMREDEDVKAQVKAAIIKWFQDGCPTPRRSSW